jgi:DHA2 family methylenomycin A resistance protein-like MFS transporter
MVNRERIALFALCLAFLVVQLDATIVNVALVAIGHDLGGSLAGQEWVVDGYTVAFAAAMLAAGAAGDRFGARRICLGGLVVFGAASALCALAPGLAALCAARVLQGVGAAALLPCSLALIARQFPDPRRRAHALGVWGAMGSLGMALGPALGGALVTAAGWRMIFLVNLPYCLVAVLLIRASSAADRRRVATGLDLAGPVLGTLGLAALVGGCIEFGGGRYLPGLALLVAAVVLVVLLLRQERRATDPMLPPVMLCAPRFAATVGAGFLFNFCIYGALLCLTFYLQLTRHIPAWRAGLLVLPMTVTVGVGSTVSGLLTARVGPRLPMLAGFTAGGLGVLIMAWGSADDSTPTVVLGSTVLGCCALAMPAMTALALSTAPEADTPGGRTGLAGGVLNTARQTGGALGVAVLGGVYGGAIVGGTTAPLLAPALVGAGSCLLAVLLTLRATRSAGRDVPAEAAGPAGRSV